jgi:hypothetical protein
MALLNFLGVDHPQGQGKLEAASCDVNFIFIEPQDLEKTPYILFTSIGEHTHTPPPPSKTPSEYIHEMAELICRINDPGLTTGKFKVREQIVS